MSYRQLWEGGDGHSFLMRLDGRTKLSFLFCYALMMIIVDNARTLFFLFTLTLVFHSWERRPSISGGCSRSSSYWAFGDRSPVRRFSFPRIHGRPL